MRTTVATDADRHAAALLRSTASAPAAALGRTAAAQAKALCAAVTIDVEAPPDCHAADFQELQLQQSEGEGAWSDWVTVVERLGSKRVLLPLPADDAAGERAKTRCPGGC